MKLRVVVIVLLIEATSLQFAGAIGCGGAQIASSTDSGGDARNAEDAGNAEAPTGPLCPPSAPAALSPCTQAGAICEYGTDYHPSCDTFRSCLDAGFWFGGDSGGPCYDESGCPATFAQAADSGLNCGGIWVICDYPEGECVCGLCSLQTRPSTCRTNPLGCPLPRPRFGEPCAQDGQECDYPVCFGNMRCTGGYWQPAT